MVAQKMGRNAKRLLLLVVGLALLLPGAAGAADFGREEASFWAWASPAALFDRLWESWDGLTGLWTNGGAIDPFGEGTDGAGSVDPNGGTNGACFRDCGPTIDPNG